MLYIVNLVIFLIWFACIAKKGRFSWHALVSIYAVTLFAVDIFDVIFDYAFNFYDLPAHLLSDIKADQHMGIIFSDAFLFPLVAIIFCCYMVRFKRPWLLSTLFSAMLGALELVYWKTGFMVFHKWNHFITPLLVFVAFRLLAHYACRLANYDPPVFYPLRLLCLVYAVTEWPGAILAGILHVYHYDISLFNHPAINDRVVGITIAASRGALAAASAPFIMRRFKIYLFVFLGLFFSLFTIWLRVKGFMVYKSWNDLLTFIRYLVPFIIVYFYDRWESDYSEKCIKNA